eukprot:SAG25_NODE_1004_length_4345_cov_2.492463_4_plen_78_part_00
MAPSRHAGRGGSHERTSAFACAAITMACACEGVRGGCFGEQRPVESNPTSSTHSRGGSGQRVRMRTEFVGSPKHVEP